MLGDRTLRSKVQTKGKKLINLAPLLEFKSDKEATGKWRQLAELSRGMPLEACVRVIGNLPDIILDSLQCGIQLELDDKQAQVLNTHRSFYHWLALHLDNTIAKNPRHMELKRRKREQPYAKLSEAVLNLASGLSVKEHWLINYYFFAPKLLWLRWEIANCHYSLEKSNLLAHMGLSSSLSPFEGKTSFIKTNQATMSVYSLTEPLSNEEIARKSGWQEVSKSEMDAAIWYDPMQYILHEGYLLAKADRDFDTDYFSPLTRAWASIRNSAKGRQYQMLDKHGNIVQTQKHVNDRYQQSNRGRFL